MRFRVQGGGERDIVETTIPILSPAPIEAVALYGSTQSKACEQFGDLSAIRSDTGALFISVASTVLVGLGGSVEQLMMYPYDCTEQLASRLVPVIALRELAQVYKLPTPANAEEFVTTTLDKLVGRQHGWDGFGMWDDSPEANPWVSAHAMWCLALAKQSGFAVPEQTIKRGITYLRNYRSNHQSDQCGLAIGAFITDVLVQLGDNDRSATNALWQKWEVLPLFSQAFLAHAIATGGGETAAINDMVRSLETRIRLQGDKAIVAEDYGSTYSSLMDSSTRTTAVVLRALLAAKRDHRLAAPLARGILGARKHGAWRSTQENAYALVALDDYRKSHESEDPSFVATAWFGGDQILQQAMTGRSVHAVDTSIPAGRMIKSGASTLVFERGGNEKGTLFYEARLHYARTTLPSQPLDRGFFVQKSMRIVNRGSNDSKTRQDAGAGGALLLFKGGDLVLVDVLVSARHSYDYVVIDDPVPAGLEAVNTDFATTGSVDLSAFEDKDRSSSDGYSRGSRSPRWDWWDTSRWFRRELRDDRTLFFVDHMSAGVHRYRYLARATTIGRFVMPPTKAELMYQPEVFGRNGASMVVVVP